MKLFATRCARMILHGQCMIRGVTFSIKYQFFRQEIVNSQDETKEDWLYIKRTMASALKECDQSFLKQLNSEIKAIKSIGKA